MSDTKTIKTGPIANAKISRACEICGNPTERIELHICPQCRYHLQTMMSAWMVIRGER